MKPVVRSLRILRLLSEEAAGMPLGGIAERLDVPLASVHRLLAVLEEEGFVSRAPANRRYFLGPNAQQLARDGAGGTSPLVRAPAAVVDASRQTGETVFVSELVGGKVVCVALVESSHPLRLFVRVGQDLPLHAAAAARVILAGLPTADAASLLERSRPFSNFTPGTPREPGEVLERLRGIVEQGYDVCESELDDNVWAVAVPVRDSTDAVIASVTLAAPSQRVADRTRRARALDIVRAAASEMSTDLGWSAESVATAGTTVSRQQ